MKLWLKTGCLPAMRIRQSYPQNNEIKSKRLYINIITYLKMKKFKLIAGFAFLLAFTYAKGQDRIITTQNDTILCRIIYVAPTRIAYVQNGQNEERGNFIMRDQVKEYSNGFAPLPETSRATTLSAKQKAPAEIKQSAIIADNKPVEMKQSTAIADSAPADRIPVIVADSSPANRKPVIIGDSAPADRKPVIIGDSAPDDKKPVIIGDSAPANRKPVIIGDSAPAKMSQN